MSHPYCAYVATITDSNDVDKVYHDTQYGVRIEDDNELFGRLVMEINQAGLSWHTILVKENNFRKAYHGFAIKKVAKYTEEDFNRLMNDPGIIRNRLKINAAIYNAQQLLVIQKEHGSFRKWIDMKAKELTMKPDTPGVILAKAGIQHLDSHLHGNDSARNEIKKLWVKEFKKHFKFVGGEIVGEFLMSIGTLPGSHGRECRHYK
jgi:DNA-3-methyladenine glycosylase I